jgi:ParB-like chromosome segregation protein Spo0J
MSTGDGYARDLGSPVSHVAACLDRANGEALSVQEMAADYRHIEHGDLTRVRHHEGCASDAEATVWLIRKAVDELTRRGKGGTVQLQQTEDGKVRLAEGMTVDDLRWGRRKVYVQDDENNEADEKRALRAVYNDLTNDRAFHVTVAGARGGTQDRQYRLHPLARAIPQISEKEFLELGSDIKQNGVELPVVVFDGQVLDGRHRLAAASALKVPLRVNEVGGDEARAKARVLSLNVSRRHLTSAQRASIVRQLFLPEAKEKARRPGRPRNNSRRTAGVSESAQAAEIAVKESGALATVRAVEALTPLDDAPETQQRVDKGELKTVAEARRAALKETGRDETEKPPVAQPRSAWDRLGCALGDVKSACDTIQAGETGNHSDRDILDRVNEIRSHLDYIQRLIQTDPNVA